MVQFKYVFELSIFIIVLLSGCLNSNEPTKQVLSNIKTIDLPAHQIIISDDEIKNIVGNNWEYCINCDNGFFIKNYHFKSYTNTSLTYFNTREELKFSLIDFNLVVSSAANADKNYMALITDPRINGKTSKNLLTIGDKSEINTFLTPENKGNYFLLAKKNNIIYYIDASSSVDFEIIIELAKKQEAKIDQILEMIK